MRSLALVLALLFTSGTVYAESAAWLEDYIETNPSRKLTKTTPEVVSNAEKAKPTKATKTKAKSKAAAKKAKSKRSKSKRGRRR